MDDIERTSDATENEQFPRRLFLQMGAVVTAVLATGVAGSLIVPQLRRRGLWSPDGVFDAASQAFAASGTPYTEAFPTSPLILHPFSDQLTVPKAMRPIDPATLSPRPGPGAGEQNSLHNQAHQIWPSDPRVGYPDPIIYQIKCQVSTHSFTPSQVLPID